MKVLDEKYEVLGDWGWYDAVPMNFGIFEVRCWSGDWSVKFNFVSSHCEFHSVCFFLLGTNVADNTDICDLGALGYFVPVDGETSVSFLYVP